MPKAIIELAQSGAYLAVARTAARWVDAGEDLPEADYHLGFATAMQLFSELTAARMALLESPKRSGPISINASAEQIRRNFSNVCRDVRKLMEHNRIERDSAGKALVPSEEMQIRATLGADRAA